MKIQKLRELNPFFSFVNLNNLKMMVRAVVRSWSMTRDNDLTTMRPTLTDDSLAESSSE